MTLHLKYSISNWNKIKKRIRAEYPNSVTLIRENLRKTLGFVDRHHADYSSSSYREYICLDFYNESKKTMFLLKYGDIPMLDDTPNKLSIK